MGFNYQEGMPMRTPPNRVAALFDQTPSAGPMMSLPFANGLELVPVRKIIRVEADGCYVRMHTSVRQKTFCFAKTLKHFDQILDEYPQFIRIHRSHLINLRYLQTLWRRGQVEAELIDGTFLPVSRRRFPELLKALDRGW
ncbi:MAG: LytTR family DNA-binding domain-containing protein [Bacteroidota bacterium]